MRKNFSYSLAGKDDMLDTIVASFDTLINDTLDSKSDTAEYKARNKTFNESIIKYCMETAGKDYTGLDMLKNPMNTKNTSFKETFDTVISQIITPVLPKVVSEKYKTLYDVHQVGFGDNGIYQVKSNELFIINDSAEGLARGGVQTVHDTEYSIRATKRSLSIAVDWYLVAANAMDWGSFGVKIARSFEAYISNSVIKSLTSVISTDAGRKQHGIGGYYANGFSDDNWLTLEKNVSAVNGGAQTYALGTKIGLKDVLPESTKGFQFDETSAIVRKGFLPDYKGVPLIEIDNALLPQTINSTPVSAVSDQYIYFLAMGAHKPVHIVIEGNTITVSNDPLRSVDNRYVMTIDVRIGIDVVVGSKFGILMK